MKIIGRIDKASFPEFDLKNLDVKVDTGAYTSTIHCHDIYLVSKKRTPFIKFKLLDPTHPNYNEKEFKTKKFRKRIVKSSTGIAEERYSIFTKIVIFKKKYKIELTLSERGSMKYPILLGRKFLNKRFLVNPSLKNVSQKKSLKKP